MNPFEQNPVDIRDTIMDWSTIYPNSYNKMTVDPYTKAHIILMNCIEMEAVMFKHNFHRNCTSNDLRREIALSRLIEQQHIMWIIVQNQRQPPYRNWHPAQWTTQKLPAKQ